MFDRKKVVRLFIPVFIETMSVSLLGMLSGIMVSSVGEDAMSAVSIVETLNAVVMNIFIAISAGVTVKVSQYMGSHRMEDARHVSEQSILLSALVGAAIGGIIIVFGNPILGFLFGEANANIKAYAISYLIACAASYASYAVFSTCNCVFRGVGDYKITLFLGILINVLHATASAILIFKFHLGVLGVGISLIISRTICGILGYWILRRGTNFIRIKSVWTRLEGNVIKAVLRISIPSAIDSVVFNGGRLLVQIFIVAAGSVALAANAVANNVANLLLIPGNAVATMAVTIVGQNFGARDAKATRRSIWGTTIFSAALELITCILAFVFLNPLIGLYHPTSPVAAQTRELLLLVIICYPLLWSISFVTAAGLRATGDVKYTTIVSVSSMWIARVLVGWILSVKLGMGVMGVWYTMILDWIMRGIFYALRTASSKWERFDRI